MARPRKPVEMTKKHLSTQERNEREQAQELISTGREQLERPPNWLIDPVAKKEYKRIVKEFDKIDVVGNLDRNNIACYCNAYSLYIKVTRELSTTPATVAKNPDNPDSPHVMNELYLSLCKNQKDYSDEMRKFASLCGLTIDSRLKVGVVKVEKTKQEIEDIFGDI